MIYRRTRMRPFPELSGRANNALRNAGIDTIEELAALSDHEQRCIHGLGKVGLSEIKALLAIAAAARQGENSRSEVEGEAPQSGHDSGIAQTQSQSID